MKIFVAPPLSRQQSDDGYSETAVRKLREVGLDLPDNVRSSGFILFEQSGAAARTLPLDSLWSGDLLEIVWNRGRSGTQQS